MSPPEIAFLALGLIVGAAIGAGFVEALRARPIPRREVRLTVSPNSIVPRRSTTLASSDPFAGRSPIPGSPDDQEWLERRLAGTGNRAGEAAGPPAATPPTRTRVPSPVVSVPATAVAVPVGPAPTEPTASPGRPVAPPVPVVDAPSATPERRTVASAVLDRPRGGRIVARDPARDAARVVRPTPAPTGGEAGTGRGAARSWPPVPPSRPTAAGAPAMLRGEPADTEHRVGEGNIPVARAGESGQDLPAPAGPAQSRGETSPAGSTSCEAERHLVEERCALAGAAREQARVAAQSLRDAQRAYDDLRERVDRAQATSDPRELRASKDALHRSFRAARAAAATPAEAEDAARDWLTEINRLNTAAREAAHVVKAGQEQLRQEHPKLERLAVEADAARITAEAAESGCRDAQAALARCEEQAAEAAARAQAAPEPVASTLDGVWPTEPQAPLGPPPVSIATGDEPPPVIKVLRGDRQARERLIARLAGSDAEAGRQWQLRIAAFVDAVAARAIEDGYLELPEGPFWGLFSQREQRDIVGALSALGFRFDGMGGFTDGRAPAPRDLSLAVGYAGLDRMRIRSWPREAELPGLYAGAQVAADVWLADEAGDLSLGRMVDALGSRAAELADLWNAWGRVRPALLGAD